MKMSDLIEIQSQIEKLQKQAQDIRSKEFSSTVQEIIAKMQAFGITVKDLQGAKPAKGRKGPRGKVGAAKPGRPAKKAAGPKSTKAVAAKFRGPNGETWSGRGLTPKWLATQIAEGKSKQDFAI
jgi:DNA-binding protein H-NS